jgi:hypothetical protein
MTNNNPKNSVACSQTSVPSLECTCSLPHELTVYHLPGNLYSHVEIQVGRLGSECSATESALQHAQEVLAAWQAESARCQQAAVDAARQTQAASVELDQHAAGGQAAAAKWQELLAAKATLEQGNSTQP